MRILYAGRSLLAPRGGGELSARTLLEELAPRHELRVLGVGPRERHAWLAASIPVCDVALPRLPGPPSLGGLAAELRLHGALRAELRRFRPQLLLLQEPAWLRPDELPAGTALVVFLRSLCCYGLGSPSPFLPSRLLDAPAAALRRRRARDLLARAGLRVVNSRYLQSELRTRTGLPSAVVPPFIRLPIGAGDPDGAIGFVGLDPWKGTALALAVARALPARRFLFVAGGRPAPALVRAAEALPQVRCIGWTDRLEEELRKLRLLLVPSLWAEPFGRLPVEAGALGIPSVAAARGGLPEAVGPGGVLVASRQLEAWLDAIADLDDPDRYAACAAAARTHARGFALSRSVALLRALVQERLGLAL